MIYDIAGLRVYIENKHAYTTKFCVKYLSNDQTSKPDLYANITKEEFLEEKKLSAKGVYAGRADSNFIEIMINDKYVSAKLSFALTSAVCLSSVMPITDV